MVVRLRGYRIQPHAETLFGVRGLESSRMVATRLTEMWLQDEKPSLQQLTQQQEAGSRLFFLWTPPRIVAASLN